MVTVPSDPTCPDCAVEVSAVAQLGDIDDPTGWGSHSRLTIGPDGRLYTAAIQGGELLVYPPSGGSLERTLGRAGEGPGEFASPDRMWFFADSLFVLDRERQRVIVFDPQEQYAREALLAEGPIMAQGVVPLNDGRLVIHSWRPGPDGLLSAFHVLTRDGEVAARFAGPTPADAADRLIRRKLGPSSGGGIWVVPLSGEYRLELWDGSGELQRTLLRERPERLDDANAAREEEGGPRVSGFAEVLWEDEAGLLWVCFAVASEDRRSYNTMIEVIDPQAGTLVTAHRFDGFISQAVTGEPGLVYGVVQDEATGMEYLQVWRVTLARSD